MKHPTLAPTSWWRLAIWLTALATIFLTFFLFVPVFVALRAGLSGVSLVVFVPLFLIAAFLGYMAWQRKLKRPALLAILTASVALLAVVGSYAGYQSVARKEGVRLSFAPLRYVKFTGDSIEPLRTNVYKEVDGQQLHFALYNEDVTTPKPTVILVHGGGWQYGNYLRTNNWPKLFRDAGYQVISVEYRLASPDTPTWDKAPMDVRDAVAFIKTYAPKLGIDAQKIALLGQSAGGHLALLEANASLSVRAVVGLYAPTDLSADFKLSVDKDAELAFLGGTPSDYPERYQAVSVPGHVTASAPLTLLIQGTSDDLVDTSSSAELAEQLRGLGVKHHLILIPYTGHSFDNQVGGFATQIAEKSVLDFLSQSLR